MGRPVGSADRRVADRLSDAHVPFTSARVRPGHEVVLVDVSSAGALVEGGARLLPGRQVELQLASADGTIVVPGHVVRSYVWFLAASRVLYRSALAFRDPLTWHAQSP